MGKGKSVYVFGLECSVCGRAYLAKMDVLDNGSTDVRVMTVLFEAWNSLSAYPKVASAK